MNNKLTRYNNTFPTLPSRFIDHDSIFSQMDNYFRDTFEPFFDDDTSLISLFERSAFPKCDIKELPDKIIATVEIPGLDKENVKVEVVENVLVVRGNKRSDIEDKNEKYLRRELKRSSFSRQICVLSDNLDVDKIDAAFLNGLLNITIPKKIKDAPKLPPKNIEIK